jgi:hypothetical protein
MTALPESFDSLWDYCLANRRVIRRDWLMLYDMLADKKTPPLPLILAAMPIEKQLRFREHIQWATDHSQLDQIGAYLRALLEEQWFHFGKL